MSAPHPGFFIAFEGGDGAGKSTQSRLLAEHLTGLGHSVVTTREPGGTDVGQTIRSLLLDPATGDLDPRTEVLLYAADRAEHLNRVVRPALADGSVVITDRYVDSTYAYQGAGRALNLDDVKILMGWATDGLVPDLTVLLDADPTAAMSRFEGRDRIEAAGAEFHQRVRQGFLDLAAEEPHRYLVLDAREPIETLARSITAAVVVHLRKPRPGRRFEHLTIVTGHTLLDGSLEPAIFEVTEVRDGKVFYGPAHRGTAARATLWTDERLFARNALRAWVA